MKQLLSLSNISKIYNDNKVIALNEVSFNCEKGEVIAIIGSSGSGKSTLLRVIAGLEIPDSGQIILNQKIINDNSVFIPPEQRDCSLVFQDFALFPNMTIKKNIFFGKNSYKNKTLIKKLINFTQLDFLLDRYPHEISGGEQQRVALVRALSINPSLLLLDEPLSHLDNQLKDGIRVELMNFFKKIKSTAIFVSHDTEDAMAMADKVIVLNNGKVIQIGSPIEIYQYPINSYVARLFGKTNIIPSKLCSDFPHQFVDTNSKEKVFSIRPHEFKIIKNKSKKTKASLLVGVVRSINSYGGFQMIRVKINNDIILSVQLPLSETIEIGQTIDLKIDY